MCWHKQICLFFLLRNLLGALSVELMVKTQFSSVYFLTLTGASEFSAQAWIDKNYIDEYHQRTGLDSCDTAMKKFEPCGVRLTLARF